MAVDILSNNSECENEKSFQLHLMALLGSEFTEVIRQTTTVVILDVNPCTFL